MMASGVTSELLRKLSQSASFRDIWDNFCPGNKNCSLYIYSLV